MIEKKLGDVFWSLYYLAYQVFVILFSVEI